MSSSAQSKTIRSSSTRYNYYRSSADEPVSKPKKRHHYKLLIFLVLLLVISPIAYKTFFTANTQANPLIAQTNPTKAGLTKTTNPTKVTPAVAATTTTVNHCSSNTLDQLILVSVSARHLWACSGSQTIYDSPVVTGDTQYADTITPLGTYHIYAKETDRYLTGSDENGSWDDYVHYWMPFLDNQYGAYGLHDATWRTADEFGNINPDSSNASNGCVELPLATAAWLYNWDEVGTTVTIES